MPFGETDQGSAFLSFAESQSTNSMVFELEESVPHLQAEGAPIAPAQHPAAHAQAAGGVSVEQPGRRRIPLTESAA